MTFQNAISGIVFQESREIQDLGLFDSVEKRLNRCERREGKRQDIVNVKAGTG